MTPMHERGSMHGTRNMATRAEWFAEPCPDPKGGADTAVKYSESFGCHATEFKASQTHRR